tara:strand:+ start:25 stop:1146 length:1122 start_codon:yes stop_codon:yes gene_type:complete
MKYVISIIILLLIPITFALTETSEIFNENQEYSADGRTIKVHNIFEEGIIVSVDNSGLEILRVTETIKVKQVNLTIEDIVITPEEKYVDLEIKVINKFECTMNSECYDGDIKTKDSCNISKNICKYEEITQCIDNDGYCPSNCFENSDNDCKLFCEKDDDCDDKNPCTIDSCNGDNLNRGKCEYINKTACDSSDDCCPDGCKKTSEIFEFRDLDCNSMNECSSDNDCNDEKITTDDICFGDGVIIPKSCKFIENDQCLNNDGYCSAGCSFENDNDCYVSDSKTYSCPLGEEKNENDIVLYCDGNKFYPKKVGGSLCSEDYECRLNECIDKRCISEEYIENEKNFRNLMTGFSIFFIFVLLYYIFVNKMKNNNL